MFWVFKRTVSLRRFFRVPTTYVLVEKKIIFWYSLLTKGLADREHVLVFFLVYGTLLMNESKDDPWFKLWNP